jgi:hypothetical protein
MLNAFQHLTASLYFPPSLGEILKQVQHDVWKDSSLTAHHSSLTTKQKREETPFLPSAAASP